MAARWFAFVIWAVVAASAAAWALRLFVPARPAPLHASTVDTAVSARGDLTRLFGAEPSQSLAQAAPPADSRFRLIGVAAPRSTGEGLALIAVDGKPARVFRIGAAVDGETVLQAVRPRGASLGPRGGVATVSLEIPPLPAAATGTLPVSGEGPPTIAPSSLPPPPPGLPAMPEATPTPGPAQPPQS